MHMQRYVVFLLDLADRDGRRVIPESVRYEPSDMQPTNAFVWKVVCDGAGKVIIWAAKGERASEPIATACWRGDHLADYMQKADVPTGYQWDLVEDELAHELRARGLAGDPMRDPLEDVTDIEAQLRHRGRDWPRREQQPAMSTARRRAIAMAIFGGVLMVVALAAIVVAMVASKPRPSSVPAAPIASPVPSPAPTPIAPAAAPNQPASLAEAIAAAKPAMTDSTDELPPGSKSLASYAARRLSWADVDVPAETSIPLVLKDSAVERGKRLCASGAITRIERRDLDGRKVYVGGLTTSDGDAIAFVVVGATGDLVKRSTGKLCGVATGRNGDAVAIIGMFDLPENRHPIVESGP